MNCCWLLSQQHLDTAFADAYDSGLACPHGRGDGRGNAGVGDFRHELSLFRSSCTYFERMGLGLVVQPLLPSRAGYAGNKFTNFPYILPSLYVKGC